MIIRIIREIRGITLDDNPYLLEDIMRAFDGFQRARISGLEVAKQIVSDTSLWLQVSLSGGRDRHWYFRNANHIAYSCYKELRPLIDDLYSKALVRHLEPDKAGILIERAKDIMLFLREIEKLALKTEIMKMHRDLVNTLTSVQKRLFILEAAS